MKTNPWKDMMILADRACSSLCLEPDDIRESLRSGLLWGVTVTPFAEKDENGQGPEYGSEGDLLPRCENCWGYFNTYYELEQWSWNYFLCGTLNGLSSKAITRYSRPDSCPEMMSSFVDLELLGERQEGVGLSGSSGQPKVLESEESSDWNLEVEVGQVKLRGKE
nr:hypothetical protein CFP56_41631 [Quercus suber]